MTDATIRAGRDEDSDGLIELIGAVFTEYENCILDVDGEMPELLEIASYYERQRGKFWVAEAEGRVVGCIGVSPAVEGPGVELKKLYVAKRARTSGLGGQLVDRIEAEATDRRAEFIELWTDTRFETAHRFYARRGYQRLPETRELFDKSDTVEYHYIKRL